HEACARIVDRQGTGSGALRRRTASSPGRGGKAISRVPAQAGGTGGAREGDRARVGEARVGQAEGTGTTHRRDAGEVRGAGAGDAGGYRAEGQSAAPRL